jgi:hypothetical protein
MPKSTWDFTALRETPRKTAQAEAPLPMTRCSRRAWSVV